MPSGIAFQLAVFVTCFLLSRTPRTNQSLFICWHALDDFNLRAFWVGGIIVSTIIDVYLAFFLLSLNRGQFLYSTLINSQPY